MQPVWRAGGRTFGIVGLGRIGSAAAPRAKALGMDVLFYDPYAPDGRDKSLGVRRVETFDELLAVSHVLSLHCPLTPETRHMIHAASIERLPRGSFLVNTGRGGRGRHNGHSSGDCLGQPGRRRHRRLRRRATGRRPRADRGLCNPEHPAYHRVLINPHSAFYCEEGLNEMRVKGADACRRAILGLPLRNVVN